MSEIQKIKKQLEAYYHVHTETNERLTSIESTGKQNQAQLHNIQQELETVKSNIKEDECANLTDDKKSPISGATKSPQYVCLGMGGPTDF